MATCSSIPAWRIPWTEEPGWLQSVGYRELGTTERLGTEHKGNAASLSLTEESREQLHDLNKTHCHLMKALNSFKVSSPQLTFLTLELDSCD